MAATQAETLRLQGSLADSVAELEALVVQEAAPWDYAVGAEWDRDYSQDCVDDWYNDTWQVGSGSLPFENQLEKVCRMLPSLPG